MWYITLIVFAFSVKEKQAYERNDVAQIKNTNICFFTILLTRAAE